VTPRLDRTTRPLFLVVSQVLIQLGLRAVVLWVYAPTFGPLRLVVTRNRHGNCEYLVSNDRHADLTRLILRKRSRWAVETIFRNAKQFAGLAARQC